VELWTNGRLVGEIALGLRLTPTAAISRAKERATEFSAHFTGPRKDERMRRFLAGLGNKLSKRCTQSYFS
jgi:hypothetical protein